MMRTKRPAPPNAGPMTQDRLRERRRGWLPVHYTGTFSLTDEILAITDPLAERVAARPLPRAYAREVGALADAVHELAGVVVGLLAERDAQRKTTHLGPDKRPRSVQLLVDLAARPTLPEITESHLANGTWPALLTELARPYGAPLAEYLGAATPPGSGALRGALSISERLEAALRAVDAEASILRRRLDRAPASRRNPTPPQSSAEVAKTELRALGIEV